MADDREFEPRLGRIRALGSKRGAGYLRRVLRAAALAGDGRRPGRPSVGNLRRRHPLRQDNRRQADHGRQVCPEIVRCQAQLANMRRQTVLPICRVLDGMRPRQQLAKE